MIKRTIYKWHKWWWYGDSVNRGTHYIQKTNEVTNMHVSPLAGRLEAQRAQKALQEETKKKEFDARKKQEQKNNAFDRTEAGRIETCNKCKYHGKIHEPQRCPAYGKSCSRGRKLSHFEQVHKGLSRQLPRYDTRCRVADDMPQDNDNKEVATQEFDAVWSKISNFQNIRSVINCNFFKKKSKTEKCKFKTDAGSDGNLIPITMLNMFFPQTYLNDLTNPESNKNSVAHL